MDNIHESGSSKDHFKNSVNIHIFKDYNYMFAIYITNLSLQEEFLSFIFTLNVFFFILNVRSRR